MGVVYLAEDTRLGRTVALKALSPRFAGDATRRERLRREARAAASLSHPGIATVFALEEIDGELYIASEHVAGVTLRDEIAAGPLDVARVVDTALAIARPLAAAHDRGLVHRDLKPENVMRTPDGAVKILDFGLAQMHAAGPGAGAAPRLTEDGAIIGTPAYMSPEQIRNLPLDARSDLFSLGVLIVELATGDHPFAGGPPTATVTRPLATDANRVADHSASDPTRPAWLDPIVRTLLQEDPDARYHSAHDLVAALELARDGLAAGLAPPAGRLSSPSGPSPRWWWQFHQAVASATYIGLLVPLWLARDWIGGVPGLALFLAALVAVVVASALRLHLWFTLRAYPSEWDAQRASSARAIRLADLGLAAALVVVVALTLGAHARIAVLLVTAAVAIVLSSVVIEPATTRAAFRRR